MCWNHSSCLSYSCTTNLRAKGPAPLKYVTHAQKGAPDDGAAALYVSFFCISCRCFFAISSVQRYSNISPRHTPSPLPRETTPARPTCLERGMPGDMNHTLMPSAHLSSATPSVMLLAELEHFKLPEAANVHLRQADPLLSGHSRIYPTRVPGTCRLNAAGMLYLASHSRLFLSIEFDWPQSRHTCSWLRQAKEKKQKNKNEKAAWLNKN